MIRRHALLPALLLCPCRSAPEPAATLRFLEISDLHLLDAPRAAFRRETGMTPGASRRN